MSSFLELAAQYGITSPFLIPLFFTISAVTLIIFFSHKRSPLINSKSLSLPPSPPRLPIIGNLHQLCSSPHRSLQSLAQIHGPIMLLHFGSTPVLVISSPDIASEIMKTHDLVFANRPESRVFRTLLYDGKDVGSASYGEYWRQMKSTCVLHLLSNKRVQSFREVREEETSFMIEIIKKSSSVSVNLTEILARLTNDIVCRVALGRKYGSSREERGRRPFKDILSDFFEVLGGVDVGEYIPWLSWINHVNGFYAKMDSVAKEFDDFLDAVVEEHIANDGCQRQDNNNKDFVDVLLWIQKENMAGFPIDRTSIKALILDVFAAGTDTTYTVLEWIMTELLRHPQIMKKLQNELREVAQNKSFITEDDLNKINYLRAVIKETLRLHPPIPLLVPRISRQDVKLDGFDIAAGTQVFINTFAIGRDPSFWDRPEEFLPDRFLNSSIDFKGHDFQLIPFGSGRRICPGVQFAMSIIELALANLVYNFDWGLHGIVDESNTLDITESTGLTIHKKFPLIVVATPCSFRCSCNDNCIIDKL